MGSKQKRNSLDTLSGTIGPRHTIGSMINHITFRCSNCHVKLHPFGNSDGFVVDCPKCRRKLLLPLAIDLLPAREETPRQ